MSLPEDWRVVMALSHRPATQDAPELAQLALVLYMCVLQYV